MAQSWFLFNGPYKRIFHSLPRFDRAKEITLTDIETINFNNSF